MADSRSTTDLNWKPIPVPVEEQKKDPEAGIYRRMATVIVDAEDYLSVVLTPGSCMMVSWLDDRGQVVPVSIAPEPKSLEDRHLALTSVAPGVPTRPNLKIVPKG